MKLSINQIEIILDELTGVFEPDELEDFYPGIRVLKYELEWELNKLKGKRINEQRFLTNQERVWVSKQIGEDSD